MRAILQAACIAAAIASTPAASEPGPVGNWLMNEPLSLWDKGMLEMRQAARSAAKKLRDKGIGSEGMREDTVLTHYDWHNNEIEIRLNDPLSKGPLTHQNCNMIRIAFIRQLFAFGFSLEGKALQEAVLGDIRDWFSHYGYARIGRDKKLAEKLTRIIFVRVQLYRNYRGSGSKGISCRARVMQFDNAPSKPISQ